MEIMLFFFFYCIFSLFAFCIVWAACHLSGRPSYLEGEMPAQYHSAAMPTSKLDGLRRPA